MLNLYRVTMQGTTGNHDYNYVKSLINLVLFRYPGATLLSKGTKQYVIRSAPFINQDGLEVRTCLFCADKLL